MNHFFEQEAPMEVLWHDILEVPAVDSTFRPRAFVSYARPGGGFSTENGRFQRANHRNSTRRMIELLRTIWAASVDRRERESSQGYRHMIKERCRREKMKQSYGDLLSMLPPGTKGDSKTVVQAAASHLINLKGLKEELQRRNEELQASLERERDTSSEAANVEFQIEDDQSSPMGLMIEFMKHWKNRGLKIRAIRSMPSDGGLKVSVETVNEASGNALAEVQQQVAGDFVEASNGEAPENWSFWREDVA